MEHCMSLVVLLQKFKLIHDFLGPDIYFDRVVCRMYLVLVVILRIRSIWLIELLIMEQYLNGIYHPVGVAVDRFGDVYLGMAECCIVMKWSLNATNGTIFAGQMGNGQITSDLLVSPSFIYLDEDRNALYVTDRNSNRIQKFIIGGNGTGMTVAGNGTAGGELNQLNSPRGIWVSPDGQRLYIADAFNTRIMKWTIGDNQGSILIDNTNLTNGNSNSLLNNPIHVALDPTETFVYIVDNGNHRVQRFRIR